VRGGGMEQGEEAGAGCSRSWSDRLFERVEERVGFVEWGHG
jgi:hypothetical protein